MAGIVPVFDPTTGASGGPAAGGGGGGGISANPSGTPVDLTDGSWTLLDPLSIVQSTAYDSGTNTNTVTCNAAPASAWELTWGSSGATINAPRWYRALSIGGVAMTTDDFITAIYRFAPLHSVTDFSSGGVCALAEDPTSTTTASVLGAGAIFMYFAGGNIQSGVWGATLSTFESSSSANRYARSTSFYGAGVARYMTWQGFTSADVEKYEGYRNANLTLTASVPVYEMVGLGVRTHNNTISLNDQWAIQAWSTFLKQA